MSAQTKVTTIVLEDIKVNGYIGSELERISLYKVNKDILNTYEFVMEKDLQDTLSLYENYKGQRVLPLKNGEITYLVFVFKITEDPAEVPGLITITYKWGWFKRTQSFES